VPKKTGVLLGVLFLLLVFIVVGCAGFGGKSTTQLKEQAAGKVADKKASGDEAVAPNQLTREPEIKVYMHKTGQIKSMSLETYLQGVVAGEMKNDWPIQALAAQAVLARTYTMEIMARRKGAFKGGADISTDITEAQAYNAEDINDNVKKAVQMTKGIVALHNDRYIHAWYFSSAGGITATAKEGLAYKKKEPAYIKVVKTPEENSVLSVGKRDWTYNFTSQQIISAAEQISGKNVGTLQGIAIGRRGPSGRADIIKVKGSNGQVNVKGAEIRIRLGSEKMKSLLLTNLSYSNGQILMKGRGFGHGVGMSQYGAYGLAKQNKKYNYILKHYFKNITIKKIYS